MISIDIKDTDNQCEVTVSYKVNIEEQLSLPLRTLTEESLTGEIDVMIKEVLLLVAKDIKRINDERV